LRKRFVKQNLPPALREAKRARAFRHPDQVDEIANRRDFLRKAFMAHWVNMTTGDYVEFGCAGATTFRCAFQASRGIFSNRTFGPSTVSKGCRGCRSPRGFQPFENYRVGDPDQQAQDIEHYRRC
jgi:hypothetical protein